MPRRFKIFSRCEGAAAVEFALILPILILLVLGGMDIGHRYYMQHLITTASREGARYAVKYNDPLTPDPTPAAVSDYVKLPAGLNYNAFNLDSLTVNTTYAGSFPNKIATVTVTAEKNWWILDSFNFYGWLPLTNPQTLTAATAMNMERTQ